MWLKLLLYLSEVGINFFYSHFYLFMSLYLEKEKGQMWVNLHWLSARLSDLQFALGDLEKMIPLEKSTVCHYPG